MATVAEHDRQLTEYALASLAELDGVTVYGPASPDARGGVISFTLDGIHPHDVATILDGDGVAVRAGHHCTKPLHRTLGVPATARATFHVYTTSADIDALNSAIQHAQKVFAA